MASHIVYSNTAVNSTANVVNIAQHTDAIYFLNKDYNGFVEIKLNGGPHTVVLPDINGHFHGYVVVPGDYTSFQILTAGANVAVYAVG